MLSLSRDMSKLAAGGVESLIYKKKKKLKKPAKALMVKWHDEMQKALEQIQKAKEKGPGEEGQAQKQVFPHPTHQALELPKQSPKASPKVGHVVSTDEQYKPDLTSGSEGTEDELGDFTKRGKKKAKSTAKSSTGKGFNPSLKPIEEKML